jgi:hypothetical protein
MNRIKPSQPLLQLTPAALSNAQRSGEIIEVSGHA